MRLGEFLERRNIRRKLIEDEVRRELATERILKELRKKYPNTDRILFRLSGKRLRRPPTSSELAEFSKKLDEVLKE